MKVRVTHTIDESLSERLEQAKEETRRTKSSIVQEALQEWLKKHTK